MNATLHLDDDFKNSLATEISRCVHEVLADVQVQKIKPFMSQKEAAALLGIAPDTFKKLVDDGLPIIQIGSRKIVEYAALAEFLKDYTE